VIGREELTRAPEFATAAARRDRRDQIAAIIQAWTGPRAKADVVRILATAGVPAAPVNNVAEMVADPQVQAREMFVQVEHPRYGPLTTTGTPLKLSETPGRVRWLAPMPGEHNEHVFIDLLGHSPADLERWRAEGVI
ncbi:MAG: CoA transferase, partial [Candidatus Rokuibacteriota bacterium]